MKVSVVFPAVFVSALCFFEVSAWSNFTNTTNFPVFFVNPQPPAGVGRNTSIINSNVTSSANTTAFTTSFITPITTATPSEAPPTSAQKPVQGSPEPAQRSESALLPSSTTSTRAVAAITSSTEEPDRIGGTAAKSMAAGAPGSTPASTHVVTTVITPPSEPNSATPDTINKPGNPLHSPSQGQPNSGQDSANPKGILGGSTIPFAGDRSVPNVPLTSLFGIPEGPGNPRSGIVTVASTPIAYETSGSALIVGGSKTLTPGGVITVNSVPVSLPTSGALIVVGSSTVPLGPSPILTASLTAVALPAAQNQVLTPGSMITISNIPISLPTSGPTPIIGSGSTLTPGVTTTVNNVPIYLPSSGSSVLIGGSPIRLELPATQTAPQATPAPLIIQGQTLTPGGVITISGTPISLPPSGAALIIGGSNTVPLSTAQAVSIGSQALAISRAGPRDMVIDGQTLTPGGVITIANTPVSLPASGSSLVVGGSTTIPLVAAQTISVGSQALAISQAGTSAFVIDGQTIAPGSQTVVSGVTVSIPTQGTDVIIDASTTAALGGAILSGLGITPSPIAPVVGVSSVLTTGTLSAGISSVTGGSNGTLVSPSLISEGSSVFITYIGIWKKLVFRVGLGLGCAWASDWM